MTVSGEGISPAVASGRVADLSPVFGNWATEEEVGERERERDVLYNEHQEQNLLVRVQVSSSILMLEYFIHVHSAYQVIYVTASIFHPLYYNNYYTCKNGEQFRGQ